MKKEENLERQKEQDFSGQVPNATTSLILRDTSFGGRKTSQLPSVMKSPSQ
jgi:hypothetical protein